MNELNSIYQNYAKFMPCLEAIESNKNIFKTSNHATIFSFLLGYFNQKMDFYDFNNINNIYQKENFNLIDFEADFKRISKIFCDYFENKRKNLMQNNIINNNINNINIINVNVSNSDVNLNKSNVDNNNINEVFKPDNYNSNSNYNILAFSGSKNFNNINVDNNRNNNIFNNVFNNNINNVHNSFQYPVQNINDIDSDYAFAKALEYSEKEKLEKFAQDDAKKQTKKCEICLEEFSLLDETNYFLNCNCVLHNVCFDNMVKSAIESNNLPIKCPNCKIPVHPNFIEDSLRNVNPQLFDKYEHFSMNNFILNNNDAYSSCPTPGCEYMFFFQPGEHNFLCPLCYKNYCLNCKDEWHRGMTCQQYKDSRDVNKLDNQFFQFVKGAKFKMCPRCKFWVEKNQGCNHMRCRCGADFCYLCGEFMDMSRGHKCRKG